MPEETAEQKPIEEKILLKWISPSRPFKRRSKDFYTTILIIAALMGIIIFFIEGFMPILLLISLVFLFYVMSTIEPENIEYQITNLGIKIGGKKIPWNQMRRFWYTTRFGSDLLVIETLSLPGRIELMVKLDIKEEITKTISKYLPHEEVPASFLDKLSSRLSKVLPE